MASAMLVISALALLVPQPGAALQGGPDLGLTYSTAFGGQLGDFVWSVRSAADGAVFMAGETQSSDFPSSISSGAGNVSGLSDGFVTRINASGEGVDFTRLLGGSGQDTVVQVLVGPDGDVWLAGNTGSPDFPTTPGAANETTSSLASRIFVVRMDPLTGAVRKAACFKVTPYGSHMTGFALSPAGRPVVIGYAFNDTMVASPGALQPHFVANASNFADAYVLVLEADLSGPLYATYLGGSLVEDPGDVAAMPNGSIVIVGTTRSRDFPVTPGAYIVNGTASYDGFISLLSADLTRLEASTYFGAAGQDAIKAVALAPGGDIVVAGSTDSDPFPVSLAAYRRYNSGDDDLFVTRLAPDLASYRYSTLMGGSNVDHVIDLAVDHAGRVALTGWTNSSDFPLKNPVTDNEADRDAFLAVLLENEAGLVLSTYLGGNGIDWANSVDFDGHGSLVVGGYTMSTDFPLTPNAINSTRWWGSYDAFVLQVSLNHPPSASLQAAPIAGNMYTVYDLNASLSNDLEDLSGALLYRWDFDGDGTWDTPFDVENATSHFFDRPGNYTVRMEVLDTWMLSAQATVLIVVHNEDPVAGFTATPDRGNITTSVLFDAGPTWDMEDGDAALAFTWDFDGDDTWDIPWSSQITVVYTYPRPGHYNAVLGVRDTWGYTDLTVREVEIVDMAPEPRLALDEVTGSVAQTFHANASASFDLEDGLAALFFQFDWDGDGAPDTDWQPSALSQWNYLLPGRFNATVFARDSAGQVRNASVGVNITNLPPTPGLVVSPPEGNITTRFRFNASTTTDIESAPTTLEVRWDYEGDGTWDTGWTTAKEASRQYAAPGYYQVRLEVRDEHGGVANASAPLTVRDEAPSILLKATLRGVACAAPCVGAGSPTVSAVVGDLEDQASTLELRWDLDGDGVWDVDWGRAVAVDVVLTEGKNQTLRAEVRDSAGHVSSAQLEFISPPPKAASSAPPLGFGVLLPALALAIGAAVVLAAYALARRRKSPPSP